MQQQPIEVVLVKGREKSLLKRHPWVYEKAIARVNGKPGMGDLVRIVGHDSRFLVVTEVGDPSPMLVIR